MDKPEIETVEVTFHLGAEHASFRVHPSDTLSSVRAIALEKMKIPLDPSIDYIMQFEGHDQEDESQTLAGLLGGNLRPKVEFHLKKRPKGGATV